MATPTSLTQLRAVHLILIGSSVVVSVPIWALRATHGAAPPASAATAMILYVGAAVSLLSLGIAILAWRGIAPYQPPAELRDWLRGAGPRMVVTWGLCEGAAVVGAITYFMTGNTPVCAALSLLGVMGVLVHAPRRLVTA